MQIDYAALDRNIVFFEGCEILVADPGPEIDLLAMLGRFDVIREYSEPDDAGAIRRNPLTV